jgi:hypothetical protein
MTSTPRSPETNGQQFSRDTDWLSGDDFLGGYFDIDACLSGLLTKTPHPSSTELCPADVETQGIFREKIRLTMDPSPRPASDSASVPSPVIGQRHSSAGKRSGWTTIYGVALLYLVVIIA